MGQPIFNPILDGFSRSIGNLTFYKRDGKTYTRKRSGPTGDPTAAQGVIRKCFLHAAADWRPLPPIVKKSWKAAAQYGRGYNRFIGVNSPHYKAGEPILLSEGFGTDLQLTCTAASGATGAIDVSFVLPEGFSGECTVFFRPVPAAEEAFTRFKSAHRASSESGPLTLVECIPGREYEIHAMLSDKELAMAAIVSESVALRAIAGA